MKKSKLEHVTIEGDKYFKISDIDSLRPFFMSIVSDSNHWMFVASNGGLTAGRKNSDFALFPYYTDDKITASIEETGSKSIFRINHEGEDKMWEPFSNRQYGRYKTTRNLYKSIYGNQVIFEEVNEDLELSFNYKWSSSNSYGFVRRASLLNNSSKEVEIALLDGIQNLVPYGVGSDLQNEYSNLVDAYKRSELEKNSGLGIYALSAIIVDKAEPSEALKASIAWSLGFDNPIHLVSSQQLDSFRRGSKIVEEHDIKGERGAYFLNDEIKLSAGATKSWLIIANVNQNHSGIFQLIDQIKNDGTLEEKVLNDIESGTNNLIQLVGAADGLQNTKDLYKDARHFSNVLFNIMRGGIFDFNYTIDKNDFKSYFNQANKIVAKKYESQLRDLKDQFTYQELLEWSHHVDNPHVRRLSIEYLPLRFSRRHGDPSRPWNKFSINTMSEIDGSKILDYEGNWRDIFQNWETLAYSYPAFVEGMIHKFLNASTFDGYNPYRVTKGGLDWEVIEPDDPWSYIGYWGDHQIIYLLKLLEVLLKVQPSKLEEYFNQEIFVYANVPYRIKDYKQILFNSKDTIDFDHDSDAEIRIKMDELGADGVLIQSGNGEIINVNFIEKILATTLAKISNLIPEGGIWMNTQRPEWNDANNALVGNGVSMVTLYYLRRFFVFFKDLIERSKIDSVQVSNEVVDFYKSIRQILTRYKDHLDGHLSNELRKKIMDELGNAGSEFRNQIYEHSFWGKKRTISFEGLTEYIDVCLQFLEHSIKANKRSDDLYHGYNLINPSDENEIAISRLSEMLEGQVAVLSSGFLSAEESLKVLDSMKKSALFREDQYSYLLYPNKKLPGYLEKNKITSKSIQESDLLMSLVDENSTSIIERDLNGDYHFNGNFRNANDLDHALTQLSTSHYGALVKKERQLILQIFEETFDHKSFTGRSGTFYGYEGLGSIYWHMVSKLSLAVQECCLSAIDNDESEEIIGRLLEHYYEINEGIGVHKTPELYGAFPTDPYSHTPAGRGAQQPGMTGQVKEDILCRFGELGVFVSDGKLGFNPCLLRHEEFLEKSESFEYYNVHSKRETISLREHALCFTYCQVPIIYEVSDNSKMEILLADGSSIHSDSNILDESMSKEIFGRTGKVKMIKLKILNSILR